MLGLTPDTEVIHDKNCAPQERMASIETGDRLRYGGRGGRGGAGGGAGRGEGVGRGGADCGGNLLSLVV